MQNAIVAEEMSLPTVDPEQWAFDVERKKRLLEVEMAALLQRKREFDDSLKEFRIPSKDKTLMLPRHLSLMRKKTNYS